MIWLVACEIPRADILTTGGSGWAPDSGLPSTAPSVRVDEIEFGCDAASSAWVGSLTTIGWTIDATFVMYRSADDVAELHPAPLVDTDPEGAWDVRALGPWLDAADPALQQAGVDSRFDCAELGALTFAAVVWGPDGATPDCATWGLDEAAIEQQLLTELPGISGLAACRSVM